MLKLSYIFKVKKEKNKTYVFLLSFIPLLKFKKKKAYLFFIIPLKTKIKIHLNILGFIFNFLPIKKQRVLFWSMNGQGYGDNPKYIANEMIKHGSFELIWLYDKNKLKYKE